jgi:hypothetical protein
MWWLFLRLPQFLFAKCQNIDDTVFFFTDLIRSIFRRRKREVQREQELRKKSIERYLQAENLKSNYSERDRSKYWYFMWLEIFQNMVEPANGTERFL